MMREQLRDSITVLLALCVGLALAYHYTGLIGLLILGCCAIPAFFFWTWKYLRQATSPAVMVPAFLLTVGSFQLHSIEEYLGHYGPAIARIFDFGWTDQIFVIAVLTLSSALSFVAFALYRRIAIAGFIAIFFIFTRFAEVLLFVFPLIRPQLSPNVNATISQQTSAGAFVADMPMYYYPVTGHYYFPGMLTFPLVLLAAIYALYQISPRDPCK